MPQSVEDAEALREALDRQTERIDHRLGSMQTDQRIAYAVIVAVILVSTLALRGIDTKVSFPGGASIEATHAAQAVSEAP